MNKIFLQIQTLFLVSLITLGANAALVVVAIGAIILMLQNRPEPELAKVYDLAEYRARAQKRTSSYKKAA